MTASREAGHSASVLLLAFNNAAVVDEAFSSLLAQDTDDLEIVVSDDCSSDGTWERLLQVAGNYRGSKRLVLRRNNSNLGIVGNLLAAARQAASDLMFVAHGDDVSLPNRCSRSLEFRRFHGNRHDLIAADAFDMTSDGKIVGLKEVDDLSTWDPRRWSIERPYLLGAAQLITRQLLESNALDPQLACEDQVLGFRAVVRGSGIRLPEPLIRHRRGGMSQSRPDGSAAKRRALLRSARAALIEFEHFRRDAESAGCLPQLRLGFESQERVESYIAEMLAGQLGVGQRLRRCVTAGIPWSKRLRFLAWSFRVTPRAPCV